MCYERRDPKQAKACFERDQRGTTMAEYIEREALLAAYDAAHVGPPGGARKLMVDAPAEDVAPVAPELRKAVNLLHKEYEKAKQNPIVRDPLAYALYQVWKSVDGKNGR